MRGTARRSQYRIVARARHTDIITLRYRPVLLLGAPPNPPANLSANGAATKGPIIATNGATIEIIVNSSLDNPMPFIWLGKKGKRLPKATILALHIFIQTNYSNLPPKNKNRTHFSVIRFLLHFILMPTLSQTFSKISFLLFSVHLSYVFVESFICKTITISPSVLLFEDTDFKCHS